MKAKKEKKTDLPWKGIVLILAVGIIISSVLMFSKRSSSEGKKSSLEYTISFYSGDTLLEEKMVPEGQNVKPPKVTENYNGTIFCGWTEVPVNIQENIETQIVWENIEDDDNCFYVSPAYVSPKESFSVDLNYGGNCCFKEGTIVIGFDSRTVKLKGTETFLDGMTVEELDENRIAVIVNCEENAVGSGIMARLNFQSLSRTECVMSLPIQALDFFYEENGNYYNCNTTSVGSEIYIY